MDFETFAKSLAAFLKQSDNLYFVLYSAATCLLTQLVKKLFINKAKTEVLHKFDFAEILPFLFGCVFAVVDLLCVRRFPFDAAFVGEFFVSSAAIGALATAIFKMFSSLSGKNLKSLQKDESFAIFYAELQILSDVRKKLSDKSVSLKIFVADVQSLATKAKEIYSDDKTEEEKKQSMIAALEQVFGKEVAAQCGDSVHAKLFALFCSSEMAN